MAVSIGFGQFARRTERIKAAVQPFIDRIHDDASAELVRAVITATPVKTGAARSNWLGGSPVAPRSVVAATSEGAAISAAISATTSRVPGADSELANSIDYIRLLNDGSSRQAPANFVALAVSAARDAIRRSRSKLEP